MLHMHVEKSEQHEEATSEISFLCVVFNLWEIAQNQSRRLCCTDTRKTAIGDQLGAALRRFLLYIVQIILMPIHGRVPKRRHLFLKL